ncbi:hypothetical protein [Natrinema gari]|uniref:Halocin H4 n=1 Tax=Natrinema gari JCM 14663 TaxID=1230459 RepID=L9YSX7_9EURY|nr:hypothetical protein [Natrinema gari]ELY77239.1 Halocin H4 [Natrinema gari JCM 14663]
MYGEGDFRVGLGTDITAYAPAWKDSFKEEGQWEYDFTIEGTTACRFVDDGEPIEDEKNEAMWWQETKLSGASDVYSREDSDWVGSSPSDQTGDFDYSAYALARDGITLALTALNPAMGSLKLGASYFLMDMVSWLSKQDDDSSSIYRKWDYAPTNGPEWADSSTFLLARDELEPGTSESFTVQNTAIAFPEYPVITEFDISFTVPPSPNTLSTEEMEEFGIQKIKPNQSGLSPNASPERDEGVYVADPKKTMKVSPVSDPKVPDRVYEEIEKKREELYI